MKFLIPLCLFFCASMFVFTSCDDDNVDEIYFEDPEFTPDTVRDNPLMRNMSASTPDGLDLGCLTILYPFDLLLESGATTTVFDENSFLDALNSASDPAVDFIFPLNVEDLDGNNIQVNSNDELGGLFGSCIPDNGWGDSGGNDFTFPAFVFEDFCFELVYPVDVEDLDGNIYTAMDESELISLMASVDLLFFALPISVEYDDGSQIAIGSEDEFYELVFLCDGVNPPVVDQGIEIIGFGCNQIQYPFDVLDQDGNQVTINDADEYAQLVLNGSVSQIIFPFTLETPDGTLLEINNIDDLVLAFQVCGIDIIIGTPGDCDFPAHVALFFNALNIFSVNNYEYDINYPVTLIVEGNPIVVNNDDEYLPAVGGSPSNLLPTEISYPVTITQFGQEIVLSSDDDVCDFYRTLDEPCENKPAHIQFFYNEGPGNPIECTYFINYPVEISLNGNNIVIPSREDYIAELNAPNAYDDIELVYPVSMTELNSGIIVTFNADQDICEYLNDCR